MAADHAREALEASLAGRGEHELFPCDPALADTAAFCAAYGFALADSANTILVVGKSAPPVYAACIVLATHRLDVNRSVRARLGTRKTSFASPEETRMLTGHEIGGVTAFGLPDAPRGRGDRGAREVGGRVIVRLAVPDGHAAGGMGDRAAEAAGGVIAGS